MSGRRAIVDLGRYLRGLLPIGIASSLLSNGLQAQIDGFEQQLMQAAAGTYQHLAAAQHAVYAGVMQQQAYLAGGLWGGLGLGLGSALAPALYPLPLRPAVDGETAARSRERARGLLKSLVTPQQWAEFENTGRIVEQIDGCKFALTPGGMIEAKKRRLFGWVRERWCVAPSENEDCLPSEDKLIGQLLHLRAGPDKLRAQANIFPCL